jgi:hypothetical protein
VTASITPSFFEAFAIFLAFVLMLLPCSLAVVRVKNACLDLFSGESGTFST